ncbi:MULTISPECIES: choice-of-anchor A family protein [unclassified Pseudoalteromonas]|uniref:choice-of-anchor A family protein n=1 Tax=unclassified Pseudoalteromonas TaxID=194690 RepID=UPI0004110204|nr:MULTISPECIES: choice-of-anchor A family protein [unclassified Pseudoalteromonas]MBH0002160.1 choice-of-anchor A family protein [Pseudoalteromonas sp. SWYJZ12]
MTKTVVKFNKLSALIALTLVSSQTFATDLGIANNFSAFVFDEFKSHVGRADGAIAAGDINLKGVYSVGYNRPSSPNEYYLISETGIEFERGRQFVGSMFAGGGIDTHWSVRWGMEQGSSIKSHQDESAFPFSFDEQEEYYKNLSSELNQLDETGTAKWKWGGLYLKGDSTSETQVFNVDAERFAKAHTFRVRGIPKGATVIFNITGDQNVNVRSKSFARLRKHASKTVFNFVDAQNLNIKGSRWEGVILAPYADIKASFGIAKMPVIGQSFRGSMALLGGEFKGNLPSVAEPIAPFAMEPKWQWNSSDFMPQYNQVMSTPVVVQLNDDNNDGLINERDVADIVVTTFKNNVNKAGLVRALNGIDGTELWDYKNGGVLSDPRNSIAAADLDDDGIIEIVLNNYASDVIQVVDNLGKVKKELSKSGKPLGAITLSDINNDGMLEIITGNNVLNYEQGLLYTANWSAASITFDADNNDSQEVLSGGGLYDFDGVQLWQYGQPGSIWFSSIANLDYDLEPEIVISNPSSVSDGVFAVLEHNGNVKWEVKNELNPGGGAQAVSNFLVNKELGIVYAGYTAVDMYSKNGELVWSVPNDDEWSGKIGVSAYDFNGDGIDEVIVQDHLTVRVLNGVNGEVLSTVDNSTASLWEYPIVVDLEGDNNAELVVVSNNYDSRWSINNGVTVYGAADSSKPWKNATRIWNQHSYHQTNISQDGQIPKVEKPSWLNNNTYRSSTIK